MGSEMCIRDRRSEFGVKGGRFCNLCRKVIGSVFVFSQRIRVKRTPKTALIAGENVLCLDPYHSQALSLIAHGARELGLRETEAFCLESVCEYRPDDAARLERLCKAWIDVGETDKALTVAERLSRLKPGNTQVQELVKSASVAHSIHRGKWSDKSGDFRSKLKDRNESESLEKSHRSMEGGEGSGLNIQELIEMIHRDPQKLDTYKSLVRSLIAKEDYDNAIAWLDKACQLPQGEGDLYLRQLRADLNLKRIELELFHLRSKGEDLDEENLHRIEDLDQKLSVLRLEEAKKLVQQFPNDYGQRLSYGELLLKLGHLDQAIEQFQVSQRSPSLKQKSQVLLGRCFVKKTLFDLALEQLEAANSASKVMDDFKKDVLYLMATCHEKLGDDEKAIGKYKLVYSSDIGFRDVAKKIDAFYGRE